MNWLLLPVGFLSGICASMGIGGGFVLMLYLTLFTETAQKEAQLFNLLFFLPIAALSVWRHRKNALIHARNAWSAILGGIPGAFLGSFLAAWLSNEWITRLFALLILVIGAKELFSRKKQKQRSQ